MKVGSIFISLGWSLGWCLGGMGILGAIASASIKNQHCELMKWRESQHEAQLIGAHSSFLKRSRARLEIQPEKGNPILFTDSQPAENGVSQNTVRVIEVGPPKKGNEKGGAQWVSLLVSSPPDLGYQIVFRGSGKRLDLKGCPLWSPDGKYFVALHEDLESGLSENEASLWFCVDPAHFCQRVWKAPEGGGASVEWIAQSALIEVKSLKKTELGPVESSRKVSCTLRGVKTSCKAQ